ncbi:MAG: glycosyltransferase family 4 protein [Thermaceae bacterium]|nr:glycosyltransferase family 4 protein [Thermaceae bacterium]
MVPSHGAGSRPAIAFITDAVRVAGSEVWLLETLPRLRAAGLEPSVYFPPHPGLDAFTARFSEAGIRVERYAGWGELVHQTAALDLRIVQAGNPQTYTALLPRLTRPRLVLSHDQMRFFYPLGLEALYRALFALSKARAWRAADGVLTVSSWAAEFLHSLGLSQAVGLFNGVDPERFRPATPAERVQLRAGFGFSGFTVLYPARLSPEKNHWALLGTARRTPEYRYVLVGEGELTGLLQRLAPGNVEFWGRRTDLPQLYRAADALLQPTLAENQSLATLEAMASGLPVVTSLIPAQLELITPEITGLALRPVPALLAQALRRLEQTPTLGQRLGQAAREHVLKHHTLEASAQRLAQALWHYL